MTTRRRNFTLDDVLDQDIIVYLDAQPNRSAAVREALRQKMASESNLSVMAILSEILNTVREILQTLHESPPVSSKQQGAEAKLRDQAGNLAKLVSRWRSEVP